MLAIDPKSGRPGAVIADDLTGANEIGLRLNQCGRRCSVFSPGSASPPPGDAAADQDEIYNLDSRGLSPTAARSRVELFLNAAPEVTARLVYKKIDSTLRGHLAVEYQAILSTGRFDQIFCVPAAPAGGRITVGGYHLVQGRPVHLSEYARGVETLSSSYLPGILSDSGIRTAHLPLNLVQQGWEAAAEEAVRALNRGARLVTADACLDQDLAALGQAVLALEHTVLPSGAAGFFNQFFKPGLNRTPPCLVVCGSLNSLCRSQVARLLEREGAVLLEVDLEAAREDPTAETRRAIDQGAAYLNQGRDLILCSPVVKSDMPRQNIESLLAVMAEGLLRSVVISGLILTGGAAAGAVLERIGVSSLSIAGQLAPLVPLCRIKGGPYDGMAAVTKGGGIGGPDTLADAVVSLRRQRSVSESEKRS